ncbi:MAG TPA: alpha/beta hydrolase [Rhodanobacteraceae bacterium]|nr:alpha/beta hydrolase [Rhodanobacteraceae bacterium]
MMKWFLGILLLSMLSPVHAARQEGFTQGADKVRIHYLQSGPAHARHTLLLIPGWRISASIWSRQLERFAAQGDRVVAIDPRSQGKSSMVPAGNAPEDRAADIQRVIASLHLRHVILVGWSQGAQDVAAYVNRFGTNAVDALVLVDSPVSAGPADVALNPGFIKVIAAGMGTYAKSPRAYSDGMMRAIMHAPPQGLSFQSLDDTAMKTPVDTGISMLTQDLFTTDRRPYLKKFDKPTLVIASGESPLLDAQQQMARQLPHARFRIIRNASHAVFVDQPDVFDKLIMEFIDSLDPKSGQ